MFVEYFIDEDLEATNAGLASFLASLDTENSFDFSFGTRDLPTGVPSRFLDIYPSGIVEKHDSFGLIYVRLWLVGRDPIRLISGIFLGAARAEQAQPRRAATYVRSRIEELIDPLERQHGYQYKTWGDTDIWWRQPEMSVRAVTRQLEQFITYKAVEVESADIDAIEDDIGRLVKAIDKAIDLLAPIREFGKDILLIYFGENLPSAPLGELELVGSEQKENSLATDPVHNFNWFSAAPVEPDLGDLKGMGEAFRKMIAALDAGKHVLLMGAPGVGKTELAEATCKLIGQSYDIVTATSDWTSVHTIGGYMPIPQDDGTGEPLDFIPGVFTEAMEASKWLIIDEMNRADIDKAFGEMFTLLGGKRKSVTLPYLKLQADGTYKRVVLGQPNSENPDHHLYRLDPSWRMIGTMNTFDKASLFQMSYAFSRRVAVIEIEIPDETTFIEILKTGSAAIEQNDSYETSLREAVTSIRRVLTLLGVPSSGDGGGVEVRTVMSFVYSWLSRLGVTTPEEKVSYETYEKECSECTDLIVGGAISREDVLAVIDEDWERFSFDAIIVDEAQDWPQPEAKLLTALYGGEKVSVADGREQLLRGRPTDWSLTLGEGQEASARNLSRCLRMKKNLGIFANTVAAKAGLNWEVEPNDQAAGGQVMILLGNYGSDPALVARLVAEAKNSGNDPVDFLHCVPSSGVRKEHDRRFSHLGDLLGSHGHEIWDGVDEQTRQEFPRSNGALRILQYESNRGLEGWTTVLDGFDEAIDQRSREELKRLQKSSEQAGDPERRALLAAWRWGMISLTRPIDTLLISLQDVNSKPAKLLLEVAKTHRDFVQFIEV